MLNIPDQQRIQQLHSSDQTNISDFLWSQTDDAMPHTLMSQSGKKWHRQNLASDTRSQDSTSYQACSSQFTHSVQQAQVRRPEIITKHKCWEHNWLNIDISTDTAISVPKWYQSNDLYTYNRLITSVGSSLSQKLQISRSSFTVRNTNLEEEPILLSTTLQTHQPHI